MCVCIYVIYMSVCGYICVCTFVYMCVCVCVTGEGGGGGTTPTLRSGSALRTWREGRAGMCVSLMEKVCTILIYNIVYFCVYFMFMWVYMCVVVYMAGVSVGHAAPFPSTQPTQPDKNIHPHNPISRHNHTHPYFYKTNPHATTHTRSRHGAPAGRGGTSSAPSWPGEFQYNIFQFIFTSICRLLLDPLLPLFIYFFMHQRSNFGDQSCVCFRLRPGRGGGACTHRVSALRHGQASSFVFWGIYFY